MDSNALLDQKIQGSERTEEEVQKMNAQIGKEKKEFIDSAAPAGPLQWNDPLNGADQFNGTDATGAKSEKQGAKSTQNSGKSTSSK